jgi:outer membrane biosynthesis protein TonB
MPVAAVPRISPALTAKAKAEQIMVSAATPVASSRGRRRSLWPWAVVAAGVLLVSGVLVRQHTEMGPSAPQTTLTMARKEPPLAATPSSPTSTVAPTPKPELKAPPRKSLLKPTPAQPPPPQLSGAVASTAKESKTAEDYRSAALAAAAPSATAPPAAAVVGGADELGTTTTAAMQNSFASRPTAKTQGTITGLRLPAVPMRAVSAARPQWRITPDGHLESLAASGTWTRALADQAATFRVVSVVGDNIWAGGSGGALFHSSDDGQNWSRVALVTASSGETGTIVSIQFRDALQGVVSTDEGSRWNTSDGGLTWTRQ